MIPGASSSTYVLTSAEVGTRIRVRVTAKNASGSTSATSNATQLDALVFVRSTPLVTRGENRLRTGADGWVDYTVVPRFTFPQPRNGYNVQFFVKAHRAGDNPLAGVAGYRLVQVRLAR